MAAFFALIDAYPSPLELELIGSIDDVFIRIMTEKEKVMAPATPDNMKAAFRARMGQPKPGKF